MVWEILQEVMLLLKAENFWEDGANVGYELPDGEHHLFIYVDDSCSEKMVVIEPNKIVDGAHEPCGDNGLCTWGDKANFVIQLAWVLETQCNITDYNRGMNDAWEIAKKLYLHKKSGGLSDAEVEEIFGSFTNREIFMRYTPQEVKAKIKAWELARQEIKVGDVVMDTENDVFVVLRKLDDFVYALLNSKGKHKYLDVKYLTKTGRTIDIASVLEQIGGSR